MAKFPWKLAMLGAALTCLALSSLATAGFTSHSWIVLSKPVKQIKRVLVIPEISSRPSKLKLGNSSRFEMLQNAKLVDHLQFLCPWGCNKWQATQNFNQFKVYHHNTCLRTLWRPGLPAVAVRLSKLCPHHEHCPSRPGKAKLKKHPVNELSTNALALKDTTVLVVYKTSCSMGNHVLGNGTSKDGLKTKKLLTLQYQTQQQVVCIPFVVEPASSTDTLQTKSTCMNSAGSPPNNKFSHQNSGWKRSGKRIRNLQTSVSFNSISAGFCTVKFSLAASARHSPGYALGMPWVNMVNWPGHQSAWIHINTKCWSCTELLACGTGGGNLLHSNLQTRWNEWSETSTQGWCPISCSCLLDIPPWWWPHLRNSTDSGTLILQRPKILRRISLLQRLLTDLI